MTVYAWTVTLLSIPFTIIASRIERKKLLLGLFSVFIIAHVISAIAWNYSSLMLGRLLIACAHAIFWPTAIPLTLRLAPNGNRVKALAFIITGSSLATVLGVPLGTAIGQYFGWRTTFLIIAGIAAFVLALLLKKLPTLPSQHAGSLQLLSVLLRRKAILYPLLLLTLTMMGYYCTYIYITPYLRDITHLPERFIVYFLFVMGGAGIIGSYLYTKIVRITVRYAYLIGVGVLLLCLLLLGVMPSEEILFAALCWGSAISIIIMSLQTKILDASTDAPELSTSLFSGMFNVGIGGGAFIGSVTVSHLGVTHINMVGAFFIALALILFLLCVPHVWPRENFAYKHS